MIPTRTIAALVVLVAVTAAMALGCASTPKGLVPPGTAEPDKFLFD